MASKGNQSAFKQLYTEMINQNGDFNKVSKDLKKPLKCYVKESYPYFLVTDGFFFVPAYFTNEAVKDFHSKFSNVNIVDLQDKVIVLNNWHLEIKKVNSADVFTSYGNIEIRLIVSNFKPNLQEKLQPTRYPFNLFRDVEFKTIIQNYRHNAVQTALEKATKNESLPDISKLGEKKGRIVDGVVRVSASKGDEFTDFGFKEGNTATVKLSDIFVQEKGKDALKKIEDQHEHPTGAPKVKGAKGKKKAASKSAAKDKKAAAKVSSVEKVLKYTPSKAKVTPQKAAPVGKASAKKSAVVAKRTPALPSPGGKKSTRTTDQMTMAQFTKYLDWHEKKKGGKASQAGKILGKRSVGKASAASGKASKGGKKSKK